jgi:peptidase M28-like protein
LRKNKGIAIVMSLIMLVSILGGCTSDDYTDSNKGNEVNFSNINESLLNSENIMNTIKELSSERYNGRLAGTKGNELAAEYIAGYFKKVKLESPKGLENFRQSYTQNVRFTNSAPKLGILDNEGNLIKEYSYLEDFSVQTFITALSIKGEIKGKAVVIETVEQLSEDTEKLKDKILLIPEAVNNKIGTRALITRILESRMNVEGILCEVDISSPNHRYNAFVVGPNAQPVAIFNNSAPMMFMSDADSFKEMKTAAKKGSDLYMKADYSVENVTASNIIGLMEGNDKELKNEFIIIGAHFDHVGDNKNETYNPGAFDNGSGTAAIMEIARVLKENKIKPKKSILFIAFNGEEEGLYGSHHYADHPVYPLNDKTIMINLDMVGSKTPIPLSIESFDSTNTKLRDKLYKYAKGLNVESIADVGQGSDHAPFAAKGVDAVCLIHMDLKNGYHTPKDTIETVDEKRAEEVVKLVLFYLDKNAY